jgi:hypothetical protein
MLVKPIRLIGIHRDPVKSHSLMTRGKGALRPEKEGGQWWRSLTDSPFRHERLDDAQPNGLSARPKAAFQEEKGPHALQAFARTQPSSCTRFGFVCDSVVCLSLTSATDTLRLGWHATRTRYQGRWR